MKRRLTSCIIEPLEIRALLAHVGLDLGFGSQGQTTADATGLLMDLPGGKILAIGGNQATRLNDDGSIDSTFTDRGASPAQRDAERGVISSNRLVIVGRVANSTGADTTFHIRAVNATTGAVDTSFGTNGITTVNPPSVTAGANLEFADLTSIITTADGGYLISITEDLLTPQPGQQYGDPSNADIIYKFTSSGKLDTSFGDGGAKIFNRNESAGGYPQMTSLGNGKFLMMWMTNAWSTRLERYNDDLTLDSTFGTNGQGEIGVGAQFPFYGPPTLQADGKIVFVVDDSQDLNSFGYVVRLNADGKRDTTFADNGKYTFGVGNIDQNVTIDSQGRIVGIFNQSLFRLTTDGKLDTTFDDDGFVPTHNGYGYQLDADASDRILVNFNSQVARFGPRDPVELDGSGTLGIDGNDSADSLLSSISGSNLTITLNGQASTFTTASIKAINVHANGGDDTIDLSDITVPMIIDAGAGNDTVLGGSAKDLILGNNGDDNLAGNDGNDVIFGGEANDSISGGDGNDKLYGGTEDPSIIDEHYNDGNDSLSGNAGNDRCDGMGNNDRVAGNGGRDRLFGGEGDDRIYGGASGDWLYGALGGDQLFGEGGADRLYSDDDETYSSNKVDTVHGNAGNDFLISSDAEQDLLFGDGGHDTGHADENDVLTSIEAKE